MKVNNDIKITGARYAASAVRLDQYPPGDLVEAAFIGRSNVGKSSLINSFCQRHGLARTSATPGKTQTINFYLIDMKIAEQAEQMYLVDLPGYGYARTGLANRRQWSKFIEEYFLKSPRLALVCQLIDIRHPPMPSDLEMYNWLVSHNVPVRIVATKADKIGRMVQQKNVKNMARLLRKEPDDIIVYSSLKGLGRNELLDVIGHLLLK